ncbi:hypothetical protein Tsubulata_021421 [Turnera subulata]|uniref:Uncharacterized protein n=1 Tax=Turnera subulata TaxID=218843 RepID=A0A9Q0JJP1_9ROSI|nr:hypothetical protein Tsubulata_021421 [Turnera subulata]
MTEQGNHSSAFSRRSPTLALTEINDLTLDSVDIQCQICDWFNVDLEFDCSVTGFVLGRFHVAGLDE